MESDILSSHDCFIFPENAYVNEDYENHDASREDISRFVEEWISEDMKSEAACFIRAREDGEDDEPEDGMRNSIPFLMEEKINEILTAMREDLPSLDANPCQAQETLKKNRLCRRLREESLRRMELSARTESEYREVVKQWNLRDANRERRERNHEVLRGDLPLDYDVKNSYDALYFPAWRNTPTERQLAQGYFLDLMADCPYEMHDLTDKKYIRDAILAMKEEHKEILYYLGIRLLTPQQVACMKGQTDRNIRKVRDTALRKLRGRLVGALYERERRGMSLTAQEREFLINYGDLTRKREEQVS